MQYALSITYPSAVYTHESGLNNNPGKTKFYGASTDKVKIKLPHSTQFECYVNSQV